MVVVAEVVGGGGGGGRGGVVVVVVVVVVVGSHRSMRDPLCTFIEVHFQVIHTDMLIHLPFLTCGY